MPTLKKGETYRHIGTKGIIKPMEDREVSREVYAQYELVEKSTGERQ
jgi:hypothetical protein